MEVQANFLSEKKAIREELIKRKRKAIGDAHSESSEFSTVIEKIIALVETTSSNVPIFRVPKKLRKSRDDSFSPHIVSIGLLHLGKPELQAMEGQKWRYMLELTKRTRDPVDCLKKCTEKFEDLAAKAQACYPQDTKRRSPSELAEIMLVDGCFLLELFFREDDWQYSHDDDLISESSLIKSTLRHDLALLENQIPFFILQHLFKIVKPLLKEVCIRHSSVADFALHFFKSDLNLPKHEPIQDDNCKVYHLLHLLHRNFLPTRCQCQLSIPESSEAEDIGGFGKSATLLVEDGIKFVKKEESYLMDIDFVSGQVMIPPLKIHDRMESLFRNLIAFEQGSLHISHDITSYVILLRSLMQSRRDVAFLKREELIDYPTTKSEYEILRLFTSLCQEVVPKSFCFAQVCKKYKEDPKSGCFHRGRIIARLQVRCQRYMATLKDKYFDSPWSIIAVISAFVLLVLTALQTVYTLLSHYES